MAVERGVPAVVSAGIWPGVSALMAAEAVQLLGGDADVVDFSFYTAGTGNAGPTIVSANYPPPPIPPTPPHSLAPCKLSDG